MQSDAPQGEPAIAPASARPARSSRLFGRFSIVAAIAAVLPVALGEPRQDGDREPAAPASPAPPAWVHVETSMGEVLLRLDAERAPISTRNFLTYVEGEDYDGTIFHRVVPGYVVQGGGFDAELRKRASRATIANEWENGLLHERGTLAMARPASRVDGASNQFFINLADNARLDKPAKGSAGYAVFGLVEAGMETIDRIAGVATTMREGLRSVPIEPVVIVRARRVEAEAARAIAERLQTAPEVDASAGSGGGSGVGSGGGAGG